MQWLHPLYAPILNGFKESIPLNWKGLHTVANRWLSAGIHGVPELVLPIACTRACGGNPKDFVGVYPALLHAMIALRILDDTFDEPHKTELNKALGNARAVNIAFTFQTLCYRTISHSSLTAKEKTTLSQVLSDGFFIVNAGQDRDLSQISVDPKGYWSTLEMKTAAAYVTLGTFGSSLGTSNEQHIKALASCCQHIGMAVQLWNEYEGIWQGETSKDLRQNKITLPLIEALHLPSSYQKQLQDWVKNRQVSQRAGDIRSILNALKFRESFLQRAWQQSRLAYRELQSIPQNDGTETLSLYLDGMFEDLIETATEKNNLIPARDQLKRSVPFLLVEKEEDHTRIRMIKEQMPKPTKSVKRASIFNLRDQIREQQS